MNINIENVNTLPVPTWRWLGVNGTALSAELPLPEPEAAAAGEAFPPLETGMGRELAAYVETHCNHRHSLTAKAGTHEPPVVLSYTLDDGLPALIDSNTLTAEPDSELTVILQYTSADPSAQYFHAGLTRIHARAGAHVRLIQVQMLGDADIHCADVGVLAEDGAFVELLQVELGGGKALCGCEARLEGRGSRFEADVIYFGDGSRALDMNYIVRHIGRETYSDMRVNGVLAGESQKLFRGTIDFIKGAARAAGHESESALLLSPRARSRTAPLILCGEADVEGQHAGNIGRIDEGQMFYLRSRGLTEAQARLLLTEARFTPALAKIPDEQMRTVISSYLEKRLSAID